MYIVYVYPQEHFGGFKEFTLIAEHGAAHTSVCVCVYVYAHAYLCVYVCTCTHLYAYMLICVCVYTYMYYVCMCVCIVCSDNVADELHGESSIIPPTQAS